MTEKTKWPRCPKCGRDMPDSFERTESTEEYFQGPKETKMKAMTITFGLENTGQGGLERPIVKVNGERWFTRPIEVVHMLAKLKQELIVEVPDDKMGELRKEFNIPIEA